MTTTDDLHARLVAAVTARRELAEAARTEEWTYEAGQFGPLVHVGADDEWSREVNVQMWQCDDELDGCLSIAREWIAEGKHIVRNQPAQILRDTEAHLKILDEHRLDGGKCRVCCSVAVMEVFWDGEEETVEWNRADLPWPCPTTQLLAAVYPESTVSFNDPSGEAGKEQPDD